MPHLHQHLRHKTHVIWDWNGTLIDDIDLCVRSVAAILDAHGMPRVTVEEHRRLFRMPVRDFYRMFRSACSDGVLGPERVAVPTIQNPGQRRAPADRSHRSAATPNRRSMTTWLNSG